MKIISKIIIIATLLCSVSSYADGIDFSPMTSALGSPTFESSNPGLEAESSVNQIQQQELENQLLEQRIAEERVYQEQQQELQQEQENQEEMQQNQMNQ